MPNGLIPNTTIPYGKHHVDEEDVAAVVDVLRHANLTQGPRVANFENAVCDYVGSDYAVAVNSGTSALHVACLSLGLGQGDWLWTTPISFVASANCALYCGAKVDFVDTDSTTGCLDVNALAEKLCSAKQTNCLPKIIVVVHLAGHAVPMKMIHQLGQQYGVSIIEDAAHALGAEAKEGGMVGRCQYSDISIFSFHPVKAIAAAEGGMAVTNRKELADKMVMFRSHGITKDPQQFIQPAYGQWHYEQQCLGYNYRLSDIHAALGTSQLKKLDQFIIKRRQLADCYNEAFANLPVIQPTEAFTQGSAWHLYIMQIQNDGPVSRTKLFETMQNKGIAVNVHYTPIHLQPYFRQFGYKEQDFPNAESFAQSIITLPLYVDLTQAEQDYVIASVKELVAL